MTDESMTKLCFVDTETTGLDPDRHEIWEVGLIVRDPMKGTRDGQVHDEEYHWFLSVDLGAADSVALRISGYYDRHPLADYRFFVDCDEVPSPREFAKEFSHLTAGAHLVGAVVSFDEERLRKLLRANGACPDWHYHLVDVEALVAGLCGLDPPWVSDDLGSYVGVAKQTDELRHTALGDARRARDIYDATMLRARG